MVRGRGQRRARDPDKHKKNVRPAQHQAQRHRYQVSDDELKRVAVDAAQRKGRLVLVVLLVHQTVQMLGVQQTVHVVKQNFGRCDIDGKELQALGKRGQRAFQPHPIRPAGKNGDADDQGHVRHAVHDEMDQRGHNIAPQHAVKRNRLLGLNLKAPGVLNTLERQQQQPVHTVRQHEAQKGKHGGGPPRVSVVVPP